MLQEQPNKLFLLTKVHILYDVACGLQYLHSQKKPVVHRDLHPSNILLNENLNAKISFSTNNILNNKLFDNLLLVLNFNNGDINFNKSYLHSSKVGKLNLNYGKIYKENNQLLFKGTKFSRFK